MKACHLLPKLKIIYHFSCVCSLWLGKKVCYFFSANLEVQNIYIQTCPFCSKAATKLVLPILKKRQKASIHFAKFKSEIILSKYMATLADKQERPEKAMLKTTYRSEV